MAESISRLANDASGRQGAEGLFRAIECQGVLIFLPADPLTSALEGEQCSLFNAAVSDYPYPNAEAVDPPKRALADPAPVNDSRT